MTRLSGRFGPLTPIFPLDKSEGGIAVGNSHAVHSLVVTQSAFKNFGSDNDPSITLITPPIEDDLVVMFVSNTNLFTINGSAGWVNVLGGTTKISSTDHDGTMLYHIVTAAEAAANTVTFVATDYFAASEAYGVSSVVVRFVDLTDVMGGTPGTATSGPAPVTPSVLAGMTPDVDNGLIISAVGTEGPRTWTEPSGWVQQTSSTQNTMCTRVAPSESGVAVPATDIDLAGGSDEYVSITITLKPLP